MVTMVMMISDPLILHGHYIMQIPYLYVMHTPCKNYDKQQLLFERWPGHLNQSTLACTKY